MGEKIPSAMASLAAERVARDVSRFKARSRDTLLTERIDVIERLEKLAKHLYDARIDGTLPAEDLELLKIQRDLMIDYVDVLDERISRLK